MPVSARRVRAARPLLRAWPFARGRLRLSRLLLAGSAEQPIPYQDVAAAIPAGAVVPTRHGIRLRLERDPMYALPYLFGDYEPDATRLLRRLVRAADTVVDVGANFGWYSALFAQWVGPHGAVHAFEPLPQLARLATNSVAANGAEGVARVNVSGLGSSEGSFTVHTFAGLPHGHASASDLGRDDAEPHECRVETLDGYVELHGIERIDFLKVDVEGNEVEVLRGGRRTLAELTPVVSFEVNPDCLLHLDVDPDATRRELSSAGYEHFWRIERSGAAPVSGPLPARHADYVAATVRDRERVAAAVA